MYRASSEADDLPIAPRRRGRFMNVVVSEAHMMAQLQQNLVQKVSQESTRIVRLPCRLSETKPTVACRKSLIEGVYRAWPNLMTCQLRQSFTLATLDIVQDARPSVQKRSHICTYSGQSRNHLPIADCDCHEAECGARNSTNYPNTSIIRESAQLCNPIATTIGTFNPTEAPMSPNHTMNHFIPLWSSSPNTSRTASCVLQGWTK